MKYKNTQKAIALTVFLAISSVSSACDKDATGSLMEDNPILECELSISDPKVLVRVEIVIKDTVSMLETLDSGDRLGSISWGNSFTISSAIDKLKEFLDKPRLSLTHKKVVDYNKKMIEYFEAYILSDLNDKGLDMYRDLTSRQLSIIELGLKKN